MESYHSQQLRNFVLGKMAASTIESLHKLSMTQFTDKPGENLDVNEHILMLKALLVDNQGSVYVDTMLYIDKLPFKSRIIHSILPYGSRPVVDRKLLMNDCKRPMTDCKRPMTDCKRPMTDCKRPMGDCKRPLANHSNKYIPRMMRANSNPCLW